MAAPEKTRLKESRKRETPWKKWGPYLSERQWGTVREDYSENGNAWDYFTHDQARSRAYRWGEDGLAGISDDNQQLCFALALWNGKDPILKERLFGLTNSQGNHGEDVKECYFYLDSTPTHSYMKYLYKYPQRAFPYADLVVTSRNRKRNEFEYELLDTGVFDDDRYFDVFVEYAKASPEDVLIRITAHNRGPEAAELHLLPTLWFRNQWSWEETEVRPSLQKVGNAVKSFHPTLDTFWLSCDQDAPLLFTENETNTERIFDVPNHSPYVKDGINQCVVHGKTEAVNPEQKGTKVAAHHRLTVPSGKSRTIRLRLANVAPGESGAFGDFDEVFELRRKEADQFYDSIIPRSLSADQTNVMRQALAGMLWSKQFYHYDVDRWLDERGSDPFKPHQKKAPRNDQWHHMYNGDVISMPDKWEYPWYAAWDLAFHVTASLVARRRSDFRQGTTASSCVRRAATCIRTWSDAGVRMELRRRQSAGARLVGDLSPYRVELASPRRGSRQGPAQEHLPEAAAQLHLVGQPQGPLRQQRLRGGLPRPRQHRRLRPQRAAADRRLPGASRRHRLDVSVLREHDGDRRRARGDRSGIRRHGDQVHSALPVDRVASMPTQLGGDTGDCGTAVGRGGRLLLRRAPASERQVAAAQGSVDGRPLAVLRRHVVRRQGSSAIPHDRRTHEGVPAGPSGSGRRDSSAVQAGSRRPPAGVDSQTRPSFVACFPRCWTRTNS